MDDRPASGAPIGEPPARPSHIRTFFGGSQAGAWMNARSEVDREAQAGYRATGTHWDERRGVLSVRFEHDPSLVAAAAAAAPWAAQRAPVVEWRRLVAILLVLVLLAEVSLVLSERLRPTRPGSIAASPVERPAPGPVPRIERNGCRFEMPEDEDHAVECGDLIVPEDRADPASPLLRLHFAVVEAAADDPEEDPVVYLEGGPGYGALASVPWELHRYPFLEARFYDSVERLDDELPEVPVQLPDGTAADFNLAGEDLLIYLFDALYDTPTIPSLPWRLHAIAKGRYGDLARHLADRIADSHAAAYDPRDGQSEGMYYTTYCAEEVATVDPKRLDRERDDVRKPLLPVFGSEVLDDCEAWGVPAVAADERVPVRSDVPTLLVSGEFDPITPPDFARRASRSLSRSHRLEVPGGGHVLVPTRRCVGDAAAAFLARPEAAPRASCLDDLRRPPFHEDRVVAVDDFSDPESGWYTWQDRDLTAGYADGTYEVRISTTDTSWLADADTLPVLADTRLTLVAEAIEAPARSTWGLVCRWNPEGYYFLGIRADGEWVIEAIGDDEPRTLRSGPLPAGFDPEAPHRLTANCEGSADPVRLSLRLDDVTLGTAADPRGWAEGGAGFESATGGLGSLVVRFDDLRIEQP